jgi:hypothetical protein
MRSVVIEKTENHSADAVTRQEESRLRNRRRQFVRQNVFSQDWPWCTFMGVAM